MLLAVTLIISVLGILIKPTLSAYLPDEVTYLPGVPKQPSFRQFSGYLNATPNRFLHYWFVESERNPIGDPLVLWFNGGPGCSSLVGLLTENGPYTVQRGKTLQYNPASWNKIANVLYLESPAGVGYSYSSDGNVTTSDDETTTQNLLAFLSFMKKFPEYRRNRLFVTGESYGGYYIPLLVDRLLKISHLNFQGFAIGNPISNKKYNTNSMIYFSYYHGLVGQTLWRTLIEKCCDNNGTRCDFINMKSPHCTHMTEQIFDAHQDPTLDIYNLYDTCGKTPISYNEKLDKYVVNMFHLDPTVYFQDLPFFTRIREKTSRLLSTLPPDKVVGSLGCDIDVDSVMYMNQPDVRAALHIKKSLPQWLPCSVKVLKHYKRLYTDMTSQYMRAVAANKRFLIYDGDFDIVCNFIGNEWFVDSLGLKELSGTRPWYYRDGKGLKLIGGWVHEYQHGSFTTIRGAGHFVPMYKPDASLHMLQQFLNNQPL